MNPRCLARPVLPTLLLALSLPAADWTQWRGPNRDGQAPQLEAPATWPEELTTVWRAENVGTGYAGPLVAGEAIYLHSRLGENEVVTRRKLSDGSVVWSSEYPAPYKVPNAAARHGAGPKSTPILHDGRLFTLGISGILAAFDAESGKELWSKDFSGEFSKTWPKFGVAMSPAVIYGKLVAHVGTDDQGALIAFNPADGSEAWRWDGEGPSYCSPVLFNIAGRDMLVTQSAHHSMGLDPETGKLLWQLPFETPHTQNIMTPVQLDDLILFSGTRAKTSAVRVSSTGGKLNAEEIWTTTNATIYMSSPVLVDGILYGYTERERGNLFAMSPRTGEVLWRGDGRMGHNALLLATGGYLLALASDGKLHVAELNPTAYKPVKTYDISEVESYGHPAPVGKNQLLIKDDETLTLWTWQ